VLGWSPREFAEGTIRDLYDGHDGWQEAYGAKPEEGITEERLADLMARYPD
jgi:hypothetical protein